jgi:hypothetical protein
MSAINSSVLRAFSGAVNCKKTVLVFSGYRLALRPVPYLLQLSITLTIK